MLGIRFTIKYRQKNFRYIYFAQLRHHQENTDLYCAICINRKVFIYVLWWNLYQAFPEKSLPMMFTFDHPRQSNIYFMIEYLYNDDKIKYKSILTCNFWNVADWPFDVRILKRSININHQYSSFKDTRRIDLHLASLPRNSKNFYYWGKFFFQYRPNWRWLKSDIQKFSFRPTE